MGSRNRACTVVVVALLVLAGCTAPSVPADTPESADIEGEEVPADESKSSDGGDPDDESTTSDGGDPDDESTAREAESDGSTSSPLDIDEDAVWADVRARLDSDAPRPNLYVDEMPVGADDAFEPDQTTFQEALNATATTSGGSGTSGLAMPGNVYVFPDGPDEEIEQVLAHEYTHTIQYADGMFASWLRSPPRTTDEEMVQTSLIEGGAVYAADEYSAEHLPEYPSQSEQMEAAYEAAPAGDRMLLAPYHFGSEYVAAEIDRASDLPEIYRSHPVTTAGVLDPDSDPPATDLSVDVETTGSGWAVERTDRQGELYTRIVLDTELPNDRAVDAAAGWSDDELVAFADEDDQDAFVWTTRWETVSDADEFAAAFESKVDARTDQWADRTTVERVDERTVAVIIGTVEFRSAVDISTTHETTDIVVGTVPTAAPSVTRGGTPQSSIVVSPATSPTTATSSSITS